MRQIIIILFLIFISCKNIPKTEIEKETSDATENNVDKSVIAMWNNYIEANPEFKNEEIPASDFFHNNKEDADRLAELTVNGKKKASSGLYSLYTQYNVDLPKVGNKQIVTDFSGKAKAIIKTTYVDTIPFDKVSKDYAQLDMATNINPLEKWKKAHWEFFASFMEKNGNKPSKEMLIVCEKFETIWTTK